MTAKPNAVLVILGWFIIAVLGTACGLNSPVAPTLTGAPLVTLETSPTPAPTSIPRPSATSRAPTDTPVALLPTAAATSTHIYTSTETATPPPSIFLEGKIAYANQFVNSGIVTLRLPHMIWQNLTQSYQSKLFRHPSWSPDGKAIVFASDFATEIVFGYFDIYVVHLEGTAPRRLTLGGYSKDPSWSPDGKWIAFISNGGLFRMHPDGSGIEALTSSSGSREIPEWSPTGRYIAYVYYDPNKNENLANPPKGGQLFYKYDLHVLDLQTGKDALLVEGVDAYPSRLSWSIDERLVYFHKSCEQLSVVENKEGAIPKPVTIQADLDTETVLSVSWSPDGNWMAYVKGSKPEVFAKNVCPNNVHGTLYIARADGSQPKLIVENPENYPLQVVWAPLPMLGVP